MPIFINGEMGAVAAKEIPIFINGEIGAAAAYMESVNQVLKKSQLGGEWEMLLYLVDKKAYKKLRKLCPECMDVDPVPTVPVVNPNCYKLHEITLLKSIKLISNISYISEKIKLFESQGVLIETDVKYMTMFPSSEVKSLNKIFKDCKTCLDVDPIPVVPVVPVVSPSGNPCK